MTSQKNNEGFLWVAFIMWPFLTFIYSLANFGVRENRKFVFLFLIYYGATFLITNPEVDANRYFTQFVDWSFKSSSDYINTIASLYSESTSTSKSDEVTITDPFVVSINFFLSRFTIYQGALFAVFAGFFGFFYLKGISQLYDYKRDANNTLIIFYLVYFAFLVSIFSINGFRFWMACWVYFFGTYNFVTSKDGEPKGIILFYFLVASSSILIHFSYVLPTVILLLYTVLGNRNFIYYPLLASSFFFSININELLNFQNLDAPQSVREKSERYLSEGYESLYSKNRDGLKWFVRYPFSYYFSGLSLIYTSFRYKIDSFEPGTKNLFSFVLLFYAFTNFTMNESQLIRFTAIFNLFAIAFIIRVYKDMNIYKFKWIEVFGVFAFLLQFFISFRIGSETINALLFGPGPLAFFQNELSIYDLIFK